MKEYLEIFPFRKEKNVLCFFCLYTGYSSSLGVGRAEALGALAMLVSFSWGWTLVCVTAGIT